MYVVCVYVYMYVCMYIYMCVCVCIRIVSTAARALSLRNTYKVIIADVIRTRFPYSKQTTHTHKITRQNV